MKKTTNVKITKLMVDDHLDIAGNLCRITLLTRRFGRGSDRIDIHLRDVETGLFFPMNNLSTKLRFTIYNQ